MIVPLVEHGPAYEYLRKFGFNDIEKFSSVVSMLQVFLDGLHIMIDVAHFKIRGAALGLEYLHSHTPPVIHGNLIPVRIRPQHAMVPFFLMHSSLPQVQCTDRYRWHCATERLRVERLSILRNQWRPSKRHTLACTDCRTRLYRSRTFGTRGPGGKTKRS